ncbi:MAG: DAK2 domain-containing protein [Bacilli bacterium]|nr:DAK2 domain-containing protein [Bacilli bacterium]
MVNVEKIDGILFEKMIVGGVANLKANVKEVNDLNVFPIPDGDTGDNMYLTISGGINNLRSVNSTSLYKKAKALADGMMLNARGNSGVILSQLFNGLANGLKGHDEADINIFKAAFLESFHQAYQAVVKPVEGTILTVAREAATNASVHADKNTTINDFIDNLKIEMEKSLARTPEMLAVLKEAGVIDSGGAGLLYIVKGFDAVLKGKEIASNEQEGTTKDIDFSKFNENSVMKYGYCTEFLLQLQTSKVDVHNFDVETIIKYLETIGDSIVAYMIGTIVKIHVHTLMPYKALEFCQSFGEFLTVKIENMTLQHNETIQEHKLKKQQAHKKYAVVVVATGQGLIDTFYELGVNSVIDGGQTKNPSTKDFLEAFEEVNADNIYVFPNNSNIIMTAKEAKDLYKDANIYVIESKDFGEAYSALSLLDLSVDDPEEIRQTLVEGTKSSTTGTITKSIRDANINNVEIKNGDYIGFSGKTMLASNASKIETYFELLEKLDIDDREFLINVYGIDVTEEERKIIKDRLHKDYPMVEVYEINGQQEVYDFIIILE